MNCVGAFVGNGGEQPAGQLQATEVVISRKETTSMNVSTGSILMEKNCRKSRTKSEFFGKRSHDPRSQIGDVSLAALGLNEHSQASCIRYLAN